MTNRVLSPWLSSQVEEIRERGKEPLALLDVDLTLVDNGPRNRAILGAWLHEVRDRWDGAEAAMVRAQTMPIVFGVGENLSSLGVTDESLRKEALSFWVKAFFHGPNCRHDTPLPGAVDAVHLLRANGITVAYVTARPEKMVPDTTACFRAMGFPVGVPGTILATKSPGASDEDHKAEACTWLGRLGEPLLCADNEPGHVNLMQGLYPRARAVLIETRHSASAPPLVSVAIRAGSLLEAVTTDP
ncbi:MAG: HAD family hydrolase [Myxococcota bacterium]|nr:HAD family hydrolase [Myxococcota bacterium]MEE2779911.1 HAD family hydrolase [Myxococcota bacterium]